MDEPFGALDPLTRMEIRREFLALQERLKKTIVIVTHDTSEALLLGTRIGLMEDGELKRIWFAARVSAFHRPRRCRLHGPIAPPLERVEEET